MTDTEQPPTIITVRPRGTRKRGYVVITNDSGKILRQIRIKRGIDPAYAADEYARIFASKGHMPIDSNIDDVPIEAAELDWGNDNE